MRELYRPLVRAVGHHHRLHAVIDQVLSRELGHLARAREHYGLARQVPEYLPRKLYRGEADGYRGLGYLRLGPYPLRDGYGLLHQAVHHDARGLARERVVERVL